PLVPSEQRVFFDSFENYTAHWTAPTSGTWVQGNDEVTMTTTMAMNEMLVFDGGLLDHPSILATLTAGSGLIDAGVLVALGLPGGFPPAVGCYLRNTQQDMELYDLRNPQPYIFDIALPSGGPVLSMWVMASSTIVSGAPLCIGHFDGAAPAMSAPM